MGKDWLFWGGKSNKRGRSGGGGGGSGVDKEASSSAAAPTGCMCAVLQLFDLHHFPFPLHHHHHPPPFKSGSFLQDELTIRKGLEAPRNSLELEEPFKEVSAGSSLSSVMLQQEEILNISMNIQIKTSREKISPRASTSKGRTDDLLSGCSSSSPGAKTPTLVARLMGIDQLPETTTTSPHSSTLNSLTNLHMHLQLQGQRSQNSMKSRQYLQRGIFDNDITTGTLSLPETPRISSARRSDVERRLSLQINRENYLGEEFEFSANTAKKLATRISESKREDDIDNREGSHYARQIAKQVKESVSRNFGVDITNKINSREQQTRDDDHVVLLKPNKPSTNEVVSDKSRLKPKPQLVTIAEEQLNHQPNSGLEKCKKDGNEIFKSRFKKPTQVSDAIRNKKEEPFIRPATTNKVNVTDKKCKKKPLSNELLNITPVPTLLPIKKDIPFPSSKLGDEQAAYDAQMWRRRRRSERSYSCSSQPYNQKKEVTHKFSFQDNIQDRYRNISCTSTSQGDHEAEASVLEYQYYIQRILKRTGVDESTPVTLAKWYSPSHPLDPSIFHYVELFYPTTSITLFSSLILRCNRRLVFQLVDELLAEFLMPYLNLKPSCSLPRGQMHGSELIDKLCTRIKNFPSANCQVLEDIDALVDSDLRSQSSSKVGEEEKEMIMLEIEGEILESLVHQTAMEVAFG